MHFGCFFFGESFCFYVKMNPSLQTSERRIGDLCLHRAGRDMAVENPSSFPPLSYNSFIWTSLLRMRRGENSIRLIWSRSINLFSILLRQFILPLFGELTSSSSFILRDRLSFVVVVVVVYLLFISFHPHLLPLETLSYAPRWFSLIISLFYIYFFLFRVCFIWENINRK